ARQVRREPIDDVMAERVDLGAHALDRTFAVTHLANRRVHLVPRLRPCLLCALDAQAAQPAQLLCLVRLWKNRVHAATCCSAAIVAAKSAGSSERWVSSSRIAGMRSIAWSASGSLPAWYSPTRSRNSTSAWRAISARSFAAASRCAGAATRVNTRLALPSTSIAG